MQQLYLCLILEACQTSHLQLFVARIILESNIWPLPFIMLNLQLFVSWCLHCNYSSLKLCSTLKHWITTASTLSSLQHHTISSIDCWRQEFNSPWGELLHFCLISHFLQHLIPALIHRPHFFSSLTISPFPNKLLKGNSGPFLPKGVGGMHLCEEIYRE